MLGFLGNLLGLGQGDPTISAANENRSVVNQYGTNADNLINTGASSAGGYLQQILDQYSPLAKEAASAGNMYANALGLNGASGNADATAAFQESPGYDYQLNQGLDALNRTAASQGRLQSGQTGLDDMNYAENLANQGYSSWLSNLANPGILSTALSGETAGLGGLADLATNTAGQKVDVAGQVASGQTGANNQQAAGETTNLQGIAGLGSAVLGGIGKIAGGTPLGSFLSGYGGF